MNDEEWKSMALEGDELKAAEQQILQAALDALVKFAAPDSDDYSDAQEMLAILKAMRAAREKKVEIVSALQAQHPEMDSILVGVDVAEAVCSVAVASFNGQEPRLAYPLVCGTRGGQVAYNIHRAFSAIEKLDAILLDFSEDDIYELVPAEWFADEMNLLGDKIERALAKKQGLAEEKE